MNEAKLPTHHFLPLIGLHLLPGLIFAGCFFLLSSVFISRGLTEYLALLVSIPVCLAPVLNAFLFAIYHFYFPENVPGIFVAFVPIAYVVMRKKNWRIG